MEEGRLIASSLITFFAFIVAMGARFIVRESMAKAYCTCYHEFNEHWVAPAGYINPKDHPKLDSCKLCSCKKYERNDKDKRNTPPPKFW